MADIKLKNEAELQLMRESGRLLASVFAYLDDKITVGVSTMDINNWAEGFEVLTLREEELLSIAPGGY